MKKLLVLNFLICALSVSLFAQNNIVALKHYKLPPVPHNGAKSFGIDTLFLDDFLTANDYYLYGYLGGGYIPGINIAGHMADMQRYQASDTGVITQLLFWIPVKEGSGAVTATIWSDSSGHPGTPVRRVTLPMGAIDTSSILIFTCVNFAPPIPVLPNFTFWAGLEYFNSQPGDTLGLVVCGQCPGDTAGTMIQLTDSSYHTFSGLYSWDYKFAIFPVIDYGAAYGFIYGNVFNDLNGNGARDTNELGIPNQIIQADTLFGMTDYNGDYFIGVEYPGSYTVRHIVQGYFTSSPDSIVVPITTMGTYSFNNNFACQVIPGIRDLAVTFTPSAFVPGFQSLYWIEYTNLGTQVETGYVRLTYDSQLNYVGSNPVQDSAYSSSVVWNYSLLMPGETRYIEAFVYTPTSDTIGTVLHSSIVIQPTAYDTMRANNYGISDDIVVGSYDPNEKKVFPAGDGPEGYIGFTTDPLEYTVHFQNTGTYPASKVVVIDSLDSDLDFSTFRMLGASHPCIYTFTGNAQLTFTFDNIQLPDSGTNLLGSNGFVKYSIAPEAGLPAQTQITNTAYIYFDFNPAVVTNATLNTIGLAIGMPEFITASGNSYVYPNPFSHRAALIVNPSVNVADATLGIYDLMGKLVMTQKGIAVNRVSIDRQNLKSGLYFYRLTVNAETVCKGKMIVE